MRAIESSIFGKRDLFYNEDRSTVRTGNAPFNLALFRSLSIGIANLAGYELLPDAVRQFGTQTHEALKVFKVQIGTKFN